MTRLTTHLGYPILPLSGGRDDYPIRLQRTPQSRPSNALCDRNQEPRRTVHNAKDCMRLDGRRRPNRDRGEGPRYLQTLPALSVVRSHSVPGQILTSDAQRRANAKQDATRQRVALWLEPDDAKALERVMRRQRLPSRIAALRFLLQQAKVDR